MPLSDPNASIRELAKFWWVFAVRGGFAILFACSLGFAGELLGTIFFDPVVLVLLSLLLGFFVLGNGVLLGVAAGFAAEQRLRIGWLLFAECLFTIGLGVYIAFSLRVDPHTLAWFAGLLAFGAGCFQFALALRTRHIRSSAVLLSGGGILSLGCGVGFLLHREAPTRSTANWLSLFELAIGAVWMTFAYGLHHRPAPPAGD